MKFKLLVLFLLVYVCAFTVAGQSVNEGGSSVVINEKIADVTLAIESKARTSDTPVELTLLDTGSINRAHVSQPTKLSTGKRNYKFSLPLGNIMSKASDEIGWWQLSYRVGTTRGIVSLSELLRDDFDLRAAAFQRVIPGEPASIVYDYYNPEAHATVTPLRFGVK